MQLNRLGRGLIGVALLGILCMAGPALAKSSLGIGTAEAVSVPSGPFAVLFVEINAWQREFFTSLRKALVALKDGPDGLVYLTGLSFAYGVFHAAGPGHGKAVISSYMLANEVQLRRGIALSFVSSLLQALTALVVVGIAWYVLRGTSISMTQATNGLEILSFAMIAVFGLWLLVRKIVAIVLRRRGGFSLGLGQGEGAMMNAAMAGSGLSFSAPAPQTASTMRLAGHPLQRPGSASSSGPIMRPASHGLAAGICTDEDDCGCGRAHIVDPRTLGREKLSLGAAGSAVLAVGLRPCTGAIVVLTFALLNGLYLGGILSVLAMALGTAITVSLIATLAVFAKSAALALGKSRGVSGGVTDTVEIIGALLVLLVGIGLLGGALA